MNSAIFDRWEARRGADTPTLHAVLIYEDLQTGQRAFRAFERVVKALKFEVNFQATLWRCDLLHELAELEEASDHAGDADFVLLCAHGRRQLQGSVQEWLEHWFERKRDEPRALAISLGDPEDDGDWAAQVLASLEARAGAGNVAIFPRFGEPSRRVSELITSPVPQLIPARSTSPNDLRYWSESRPRWGINE